MKVLLRALIPTLFAFFLTSCQKEAGFQDQNTTSKKSIIGDYDFVAMWASTITTQTVVDGSDTYKSIMAAAYNTKDNKGSIKITADQFISTNVSYSIDTVIHVKDYENGVLVFDEDLPWIFDIPASSATTTYKLVGTDSLSATSLVPNPGGGTGGATTGADGVKFSWSGDTLVVKSRFQMVQTDNQAGIRSNLVNDGNVICKYKKK